LTKNPTYAGLAEKPN